MANEAVCIESPTVFRRVTVADGTAIPKGTLLYFSADPNTAAASSADNQSFAGITISDKTANDGQVELTVAKDGVWDLKDSGSGMTLGTVCAIMGANLVGTAVAADLLNGSVVGKVLETASASEVVRVEVGEY